MRASGGFPGLPPRVCLFGTYPEGYTVSRIINAALAASGAEVVSCHAPLWERARTKHDSYFVGRSGLGLLTGYAGAVRALATRRKELGRLDTYVVGFQGQLDAILLRILQRSPRVPVVFAPLVTLYETLVEDRRLFVPGSLPARLLHRIDRISFASVQRVVIDTEVHAEYLASQYGVPEEKLAVWHLGADSAYFAPQPPRPLPAEQPLRVLFYGSFLPLHGLPTILGAAERLREFGGITFHLYGEGPGEERARKHAEKARLGNVSFHPWQPYERLGPLVSGHDVVLGIFDSGPKAGRVIANKVYQAASVGRPVITADTRAIREVFSHAKSIWLCRPGDADSLAEAIRHLAGNPGLRREIGRTAAEIMARRFDPASQAARWREILSGVIEHG